jgi:hypothetical protein
MLQTTIRITGCLLFLLSIGQVVIAQGDYRRDYLGQAQLDGMRDYDRIAVGKNEGRFQGIQLRIEGAPIEFQRVIVNYANGGNEEISLRNRIPAGGQTRVVDLRGGDRAISSVDIWYSRMNWRTGLRPRVYLYGVDNVQRTGSWEFLGQAQVDGLRDHDVITVGRNEGRFRNMQIRVAGAPILFERVVVHYANGANEAVALRYRIPAGGHSRSIDLRGGDRAISRVEVWYANGNQWSRYKPRVYLYGR